MSLNIPALERSFNLVAPQAEALALRFYERLFEKYPRIKPLFTTANMPDQRRKLIAALVLVVQNLRNPEALLDAVEQLGIRHLDYGTKPEHYAAVGENLLSVMAEFVGEGWTDEVATAWADAYKDIATKMIHAAWPMHEMAGLI